MPIVLYRIDERLIHGQVVLGWGSQLRPERFLVVDDELAASAWEKDLYELGAAGAEVVFASVAEARDLLAEWREDHPRSILLTKTIAAMRALAEGGLLEGCVVNIGGVHHGPGRDQVLTYVHLTPSEREDLRDLAAGGAEVQARDLPDSPGIALDSLVGG